MKPPKVTVLRPTFGIGVAIGAALLLGSQATGADPVVAAVLGAGAGIALGLKGTGAVVRAGKGVRPGGSE